MKVYSKTINGASAAAKAIHDLAEKGYNVKHHYARRSSTCDTGLIFRFPNGVLPEERTVFIDMLRYTMSTHNRADSLNEMGQLCFDYTIDEDAEFEICFVSKYSSNESLDKAVEMIALFMPEIENILGVIQVLRNL